MTEILRGSDIGYNFKIGKNKFYIQEREGCFILATTKTKKLYTIINTKNGLCGIHDRTFEVYDFNSEKDKKELMDGLKNGEISLSYRNSMPISLVIDLCIDKKKHYVGDSFI